MKFWREANKDLKIFIVVALVLAAMGVVFRTYHINQSDFVFYDEGYYLNHNRLFAQLITDHYPTNFWDFCKAFYTYIRFSLASGKALWFATVDFRIFLGGMTAWYFPRIVSALFGIMTFFLIYLFAKRFYESKWVGWLSVMILAVVPSHVFYSRVGLQEAFSAFLVLAAFYFYIFPKHFGWRTILAGVIAAAAFFANYRLIMLPIPVAFCEFWLSFSQKRTPSFRKYLWFLLSFLTCIFAVGDIDNGQNTIITFAWIFHQGHMAQQQLDAINLFSYPYYIFRLEHGIFGMLFFGNIYLFLKRQWYRLFPFALACLQMLFFSFASEKGARYLCVMIPFMVMSIAYLFYFLWQERKDKNFRMVIIACLVLMMGGMVKKSFALSQVTSDYRSSAMYLLAKDPQVKFLSTQNYVQDLYLANKKNAAPCPFRIETLMQYYQKGFRYLVVCPQAYISWTDSQKRFDPRLVGFLDFIVRNVRPVKTFPNFNEVMLERFVFEHSENLPRSIDFLKLSRKQDLASIKIYDVTQALNAILAVLSRQPQPVP